MRPPQDPSKLFTLYGLKRPDDNVIRYIGITCRKLSYRLGLHLTAKGANPHKDRWIAKMHPLVPEIVPYVVCLTKEEACDLEIFVIAGLRNAGHPLVNISSGGEATFAGMKHSAEAKEKIGLANLGRIHTAENNEKNRRASLGNRGRLNRPIPLEKRKKHTKTGSSQFLGVCWNKSREMWDASVFFQGKRIRFGRFETEIQASEAYIEGIKSLHE